MKGNEDLMKDKILGELPELLRFKNGTPVKTPEDWKLRRKEIYADAVELEYGGMPAAPDKVTVEELHTPGRDRKNTYRVFVTNGGKSMDFCLDVYRPAAEDGKIPAVITGDGCYRFYNDKAINEVNSRGFAMVIFNRTEFAPDIYNSDRISGVYNIFPDSHFSAISAWAWGYSRCIDALETLNYIDTSKLAVSGHSRGGKAAFLAGATDERILFTNPNGSGAHGAGCYRYEQYEETTEDKRSERLEDLFRAVPYWMGPGMRDYIGRENELPHDMHFFKAFVAPRCYIETNAMQDTWGNPKGSYYTYAAAKKAFRLLGAENRIAAHFRQGGHFQTYEDICVLLDFMEAVMKDKPLPESMTKNYYPDDFKNE